MIEIRAEKDLQGTKEEIYIQGYQKGYEDALQNRRPKEPIFSQGFRCSNCKVQLLNVKLNEGKITYCHICGQGYTTGDTWRRIVNERNRERQHKESAY